MRGGAWLPLTVGLWGSPVPVSEELHSARELMEFTSANSNAKAWRGSPNPTASSHRGLRSAPQGSPGPAEATTSHLALPWGARRQGAADVASWGSEAVLHPLARPRKRPHPPHRSSAIPRTPASTGSFLSQTPLSLHPPQAATPRADVTTPGSPAPPTATAAILGVARRGASRGSGSRQSEGRNLREGVH